MVMLSYMSLASYMMLGSYVILGSYMALGPYMVLRSYVILGPYMMLRSYMIRRHFGSSHFGSRGTVVGRGRPQRVSLEPTFLPKE